MNAAELDRLVAALTDVGYKVSGVLNRCLDEGTITDEQANKLRLALSYIGQANGEVYALASAERAVE